MNRVNCGEEDEGKQAALIVLVIRFSGARCYDNRQTVFLTNYHNLLVNDAVNVIDTNIAVSFKLGRQAGLRLNPR
jgi:hypothetical protein